MASCVVGAIGREGHPGGRHAQQQTVLVALSSTTGGTGFVADTDWAARVLNAVSVPIVLAPLRAGMPSVGTRLCCLKARKGMAEYFTAATPLTSSRALAARTVTTACPLGNSFGQKTRLRSTRALSACSLWKMTSSADECGPER